MYNISCRHLKYGHISRSIRITPREGGVRNACAHLKHPLVAGMRRPSQRDRSCITHHAISSAYKQCLLGCGRNAVGSESNAYAYISIHPGDRSSRGAYIRYLGSTYHVPFCLWRHRDETWVLVRNVEITDRGIPKPGRGRSFGGYFQIHMDGVERATVWYNMVDIKASGSCRQDTYLGTYVTQSSHTEGA